MNPLNQFPVFCVGLLCHRLIADPRRALFAVRAAMVLLGALAVAMVLRPWQTASLINNQELGVAMVFGAIIIVLSRFPRRLAVNPLICWIGTISYSLYLCHAAVLHALHASGAKQWLAGTQAPSLLHYGLVLVLACPVAWLLYYGVERPGIRLGQRLIVRLRSPVPVRH